MICMVKISCHGMVETNTGSNSGHLTFDATSFLQNISNTA